MVWVGPSFSNGNVSQRPSHGWIVPIESDEILRLESDSQKSDPKNPISWKSLLRRHYENLKVFQKRTPIQ